MIIRSLDLFNFRNYKKESFVFDPGTNILYGDNAQGKTNALEALFVGCTTKSHKGSKESELINKDSEEAHIRYISEKKERQTKVEIHLKKRGTKGIAIDGLPIKKANEILGVCHVVFFSPEDLSIIKDGPEVRRRFIDIELCQLNKAYLYNINNYRKNLKQRNALLKQISDKPNLKETLEIWNAGLVEAGKNIIKIRKQFISELNELMREKHSKLTGGKESIKLNYVNNVSAESFEEKLFFAQDRDIYQGTTTVGPHRDDLAFLNGDEDIRKFGSQGQKRTAALSLKLSEIELVERMIGDKPVLLLDDVLSELDRNRQNFLLEQIQGIQTIITCTGLEEFVKKGIGINKIFHIEDGRSVEENQK